MAWSFYSTGRAQSLGSCEAHFVANPSFTGRRDHRVSSRTWEMPSVANRDPIVLNQSPKDPEVLLEIVLPQSRHDTAGIG